VEKVSICSHTEAKAIDSLSRTQRNRLVDAGLYPEPVQLTPGRVGFVKVEVLAWAAARISARDARIAARDAKSRPVAEQASGPGVLKTEKAKDEEPSPRKGRRIPRSQGDAVETK
jgi:predicted DNA-binding transcriptional regulator AlpA